MDTTKHFFSEGVVVQWHGLPREVVESPPLEVLTKRADITMRDVVSGHDGVG